MELEKFSISSDQKARDGQKFSANKPLTITFSSKFRKE